jgi:hypothetical protein
MGWEQMTEDGHFLFYKYAPISKFDVFFLNGSLPLATGTTPFAAGAIAKV